VSFYLKLQSQEARTAVLRERASLRLAGAAKEAQVDTSQVDVAIPLARVTDIVGKDGHVNFFEDVEEGRRQEGVNEDAEREKKAEAEEYEKKVGYLVYLGQDSHELKKSRPWYADVDAGPGRRRLQDVDVVKEEKEKLKMFESSGYLEGLSKV